VCPQCTVLGYRNVGGIPKSQFLRMCQEAFVIYTAYIGGKARKSLVLVWCQFWCSFTQHPTIPSLRDRLSFQRVTVCCSLAQESSNGF
jgi:hypothetical protein